MHGSMGRPRCYQRRASRTTVDKGMPMSEFGQKATVLGASIGGLLSARVLADFYDTVTVVERDELPDGPLTRRGVPQGGMPHIFAPRGAQILGELFPGLLEELVANGARVWKDGDLSRLCVSFGGHRILQSGTIPDPESIVIHYAHRPFLEWRIRRRVGGYRNIDILEGHDVVRMTSTPQRDRVTGVVVARRDSGAETTLTADLVVDATGRGSRTPVFLNQLGYGRPREDQLKVHVAYAGLPIHIPPGTVRENIAFVAPEPSRPLGFAMFAGENNIRMLAVQTVAGQRPPADRAALLECLADIAPPHLLAVVRSADPLADVAHYRFPSNRWRRYDKLTRTPDGLIVIGDAMCSFNPLYGQGMSVAAIEALILHDCLQQGAADLPQRFFSASAREIRRSWHAAVGSDLALPQIPGKRPMSVRLTNAYLDRVLAAAETDPAVVQHFLRFITMLDPPSHLLSPSMVLRVIQPRKQARLKGSSGTAGPIRHSE